MEIRLQEISGIQVISVIGSIDALTSSELASSITGQIALGKTNLILDLGQVNFMSSAGLRVILMALKETRSLGGDLRLAAPQPGVAKVLDLSSFTSIMKCFPAIEPAVESFKG